jgi:hypothetical protein
MRNIMPYASPADGLSLRDTIQAHARAARGEERARLQTWADTALALARELAATQAALAEARRFAGGMAPWSAPSPSGEHREIPMPPLYAGPAMVTPVTIDARPGGVVVQFPGRL